MTKQAEAIPVNFPLCGEWCAANTPGYKIPSHGSNQLGQRYAYDFLQIDWSKKKGFRFSDKPLLLWFLPGIKLQDTYCWSQPIYSPFQGEVIEVADGLRERNPVNLIRDLLRVIKNAFFLLPGNNDDLHPALGNYIILEGDNCFALIAHARCHSIRVAKGETVSAGQKLAEVGHSGNSTAPHLHFQLMDRADLLNAKGLPCSFKEYESFHNGEWTTVTNGIPGKREKIRKLCVPPD